MKKLLKLLLSLIIMAGIASGVISLATGGASPPEPETVIPINDLKIGDYFTLGKYNDEPVIWRYIADDEQGKLIVSDKILCFKPFGENNFWEESYLRKWLNSSISADDANWEFEHLSNYTNVDVSMYSNEKGFLHESNFSQRERSVMKTVTQWTMLPIGRLELATNGNNEPYRYLKEYRPGSPKDGGYMVHYNISELPDVYSGAAYEVIDTVFLMDEIQIYRMWETLGDAKALRTDSCSVYPSYLQNDEYFTYHLRTPTEWGNCTAILGNGEYQANGCIFPNGIRPAFYLNEDNAVILSGSGTEDDSYVIDGKYIGEAVSTDITAQINGSPILSYNINGNTAISAEDLSYYGFDIDYNDTTRTLNVNRLTDKEFTPIDSMDERFQTSRDVGTKLYDVYRSDIKVFLDGERVDSFNIDGRSLIYIDDLGKYGNVVWDEHDRTISVHYEEKE